MNNRLYGNLIFELSHEGRRGYSLPRNKFSQYEVPAELRRKEDAQLPECDELTVVRHYTNLSQNNFGVDSGFYPLGSCTMKYNPKINEEMAALPEFQNLHPLQPATTTEGAQADRTRLCSWNQSCFCCRLWLGNPGGKERCRRSGGSGRPSPPLF